MRKAGVLTILVCLLVTANISLADTFGTGDNQFTMDFVNIAGDSGNLGNWSAGTNYTFHGVNHGDYRMGKFEVINDQWDKFKAAYGTVTGSPSYAYAFNSMFTGTNIPTTLSWYEGAQFVNWLNTSTGHQAAYKFTGTQGTSDYTFTPWSAGDSGYNANNPYRNSNAFYFLPTENEWVKAAYWNGTSLQTWATIGNIAPVAGINANYNFAIGKPWNVGSGSVELNGTYDMMGNVLEWMEGPHASGNYLSDSTRIIRGGSHFYGEDLFIRSSNHNVYDPKDSDKITIRIASVPEPATLLLVAIGGMMLRRKK